MSHPAPAALRPPRRGGEAAVLCAAAALLAVDPRGLGGALVRGPAGPARDAWVDALLALLPAGTPAVRVPASVTPDRLLGGLDLAATLAASRPVAEPGLLSRADGGIAILLSAERLHPSLAAQVGAVLDTGVCASERDGATTIAPARIGVLALDESLPDEPGLPASLADQLALHLDLSSLGYALPRGSLPAPGDVAAARGRLARVEVPDAIVTMLCGAALELGIPSLRGSILAVRAARAAAALDGRLTADEGDAALAASLVLLPRARTLPAPDEAPPADRPPPPEPAESDSADAADASRSEPPAERILAAARALLPSGLLSNRGGRDRGEAGRRGRDGRSRTRGRRVGTRAGDPRRGPRLDVLATLRAAAPWQRVRGRDGGEGDRLRFRATDLRVRILKHPTSTTVVFAVDASGSQAAHRLAEVKGAVELLLAETYARRDQVALVAFRGGGAELLLPPSRSLSRARRALAELPGGGGTPLGAGIDAAREVALGARRAGAAPLLVLLTDGRPNVARGGAPGRPAAEADARAAAAAVLADEIPSLVIDTAPRPHPFAADLALRMGADYLALPVAGAHAVGGAVEAARSSLRARGGR